MTKNFRWMIWLIFPILLLVGWVTKGAMNRQPPPPPSPSYITIYGSGLSSLPAPPQPPTPPARPTPSA
jgi:hypothetical protein